MNRTGAALAAVLFVMAMAGAMVAGTAYMARSAAASVRVGQRAGEAEALAEQALMATIAAWDTAARPAQPLGSTAQLGEPGVSVRITRVGASLYLGLAEVEHPVPPRLRRGLAVLIRTDSAGASPLTDRSWTLLP